MSRRRRPAAPPSPPEDPELARALADVRPLAAPARVPVRSEPAMRSSRPAAPPLQLSGEDEQIEGWAPDVDPRQLRRLRQGDPPATAELDLHGLSEREARRAVALLLRESLARGDRVVRIVTGRGLHSAGPPVLVQAVPRWLAAATPDVRAFVIAHRGALVVLLRKGDTQHPLKQLK